MGVFWETSFEAVIMFGCVSSVCVRRSDNTGVASLLPLCVVW